GFAKGTLNGIGGKQDPGETIEEAMIRETQEEIGITPINFYLTGKIKFDVFYKGERQNLIMYVYICDKFEGEIKETEEMIPVWCDVKNIPYERMLQDDKLWLPDVLNGCFVEGFVKFDENMNMLEHCFST
ncbi:MAG: 8-oxo-dGTP diphosphatase, partial [Clostridia bacterium]|nr:8-oxo-dGTP diphosphatase [Clostridia bacterium]